MDHFVINRKLENLKKKQEKKAPKKKLNQIFNMKKEKYIKKK